MMNSLVSKRPIPISLYTKPPKCSIRQTGLTLTCVTNEKQSDYGDQQNNGSSFLSQASLVVACYSPQGNFEEDSTMQNGQNQQRNNIDTDWVEEVVDLEVGFYIGRSQNSPLGGTGRHRTVQMGCT